MLSTLGLTLVFATMIGLAIGIYLDKKFNTSPWLTIIFLLIGIAAGFKGLIQTVIRQVKKENNGTGKRLLKSLQIKGGIAILITAILAIFFFSIYEAAGIIIGGLIGILNFSMMIRFVYKILDSDSTKGKGINLSQYTGKPLFLLILFLQ